MTSRSIRGRCLCGGVCFELTGTPLTMAYCHCSRCRRVGGMANVTVRAGDFRWIAGRELVARYEPEPPFTLVRCFCRVCGTYLGEPETQPEVFPISAHALEDDPGVRPVLHEYVSGKPCWYEISDGLPEYAGAPPLAAFFPERDRSDRPTAPEEPNPGYPSGVLRELTHLERLLQRPGPGATREDLEAMLEPECWEVGASGRRYDREQMLDILEARGAAPPGERWETRDLRCREIAPDSHLLTYTLLQGERVTRRATLWRRHGETWKLVHHQGTRVEDG